MAKKNKVGIVSAMDRKCPGWRIMPEDWRDEATKIKEQCCNDAESGLTLLQSRWEAGIGNDDNKQMCDEILESSETPMDALSTCLEFGLLPPPEILLTLDDMYRTYSLGAGEITFEEAFFGKPKKGIGTYAARQFLHRDPEKRYKHFEWWIDRQSKTDKELPLTKKAELYFSRPVRPDPLFDEGETNTTARDDKGREVDVDSFLRSYRRWRKKRS